MPSYLQRTELLFRSALTGMLFPPATSRPGAAQLAVLTFLCAAFYGIVMGSFSGLSADRLWLLVYAGLKVPLLLLVTFALSLPSFFVLNTLLGVRSDFGEVLRGLLSSQAGLALVLAALAPYTALWYASSAWYPAAVLVNGVMFAVASITAQWLLRRSYRPLVARNRQHRQLLRVWLFLYAFVAIQLAWVLRPFVGEPDMPVQFFREGAWGNAYVVVLRLAWDVLSR